MFNKYLVLMIIVALLSVVVITKALAINTISITLISIPFDSPWDYRNPSYNIGVTTNDIPCTK